ncbi:GNAT family N-acetyltransferase [Saccharospirillum mangrovi]|uniref:GNAT family N-acetyltransferase n=1 Tax=Saccharospirillum mangrovi TaxID=2161747 RepID=UPI000D35101B|nr:GNAT family N-acetyltransferase [Saccharospirillum mangrovi]
MSAIEHHPDEQRFVLAVNNELAYLAYRLDGNDITFTSTFVPNSGRGQGIARQLVDTGLGWARAQQYAIHATCSYVEAVLARGG